MGGPLFDLRLFVAVDALKLCREALCLLSVLSVFLVVADDKQTNMMRIAAGVGGKGGGGGLRLTPWGDAASVKSRVLSERYAVNQSKVDPSWPRHWT